MSVTLCLENALWEQGQLMAPSHWVQEMVPSTLRAHRNINWCWFPDLLFEYVKWPLRGFQRVSTFLPMPYAGNIWPGRVLWRFVTSVHFVSLMDRHRKMWDNFWLQDITENASFMLVYLNANLQVPGPCESIGLWEFDDISFINTTTKEGFESLNTSNLIIILHFSLLEHFSINPKDYFIFGA